MDTFAKIEEVFNKRYKLSDLIKYKSAKDIFTRKQGKDESVDDYVVAMQRMARRISTEPNEEMVRFAILNGLRPNIANSVVAKAGT